MEPLATATRPLRVAVVGAGPAGLYAAEALLNKPDLTLTVDVLDRFPTPFGLVRDGVAPDHQSIKAVTRVLDRTLADPRVRLFGNVTFGVDLHHRDLKRHYDQIVYAVGAQADRRMSIPGEGLANSHAAIAFVGWYNGHPDYRDLPVDLSCERAVVVGNGNVAVDVARMLVTPPEELGRTDMADHALAALGKSKVREVVVLGRRGAAQASFTTPELRELGKLDGVDVVVDPGEIELDPASRTVVEEDRTARANLKHLQEYAGRRNQVQGYGQLRADRGRAGGPLDRLPDGADRGGAVRPRDLDREQHRRAGRPPQLRRRGGRGVRRRLGQAGAHRPHRQQQGRRGRDRRGHDGRPARAQGHPRRPPGPLADRGHPAPPRHRLHHLPGLEGP
jgi:NADPH-dependent glutamate synthase beta subunit-like oxidoreductase